MIVIVFGLPGSGKSFFARELAKHMDAHYLSTDQVRMQLLETRTYSEKEKLVVYRRMLELAIESELRKPLVIDGTFYKKMLRKMYVKALLTRSPICFIKVVAEEILINRRLATPRSDSEADLQVHHKIKREWEPMESEYLTLVSDTNNIEEMCAEALSYLEQHAKATN